jgi:hypothetical protein
MFSKNFIILLCIFWPFISLGVIFVNVINGGSMSSLTGGYPVVAAPCN